MADGAAGVSYFIAKKKSRDNISLILSSILFFYISLLLIVGKTYVFVFTKPTYFLKPLGKM